jgi:AraC family ethanolamine operon transcriptional activator
LNKAPINRFYYSSEDYDEFATMFTVANVEEKILESGHFMGEVHIIQSPNVVVNNFKINKKVLQFGTGVPGFITFAIWDPKTTFNWKKNEMKKGMIGIIWKNEHQSVTGSGFNGLPLAIEENFFTNLCLIKGFPELPDHLKRNEVLLVSEASLVEIRQMLKYITQTNNLDNQITLQLIEDKLVGFLIDSLISTLPAKPKDDHTNPKFAKVIDYIHENLTELTSVHQICEKTEVPERTVRRLIRKSYSLSPKKYLNTLRLNEVRKGLKNNAEFSNVMQIASDYNFWHMGQFTRDYKKLFGELPTETLKKRSVFH